MSDMTRQEEKIYDKFVDFMNGRNEDFRDATDIDDNAIFFTNEMVEYAGGKEKIKELRKTHLLSELTDLEYNYFSFEEDFEITIVYDNYDRHF